MIQIGVGRGRYTKNAAFLETDVSNIVIPFTSKVTDLITVDSGI